MPDPMNCRETVKAALQEAGWTLREGPARFDGETLAILDFEAMKETVHAYFMVLCADAVGRIPDIYLTIGRYLDYREVIRKVEPEAVLYLAMPEDVQTRVFTASVDAVIQESGIEVITANVEQRRLSGEALEHLVGQVVRSFSGEWTGPDGGAQDPRSPNYNPVVNLSDRDLISQTSFDTNGFVLYTEDSQGRRTWFAYDELGGRFEPSPTRSGAPATARRIRPAQAIASALPLTKIS